MQTFEIKKDINAVKNVKSSSNQNGMCIVLALFPQLAAL